MNWFRLSESVSFMEDMLDHFKSLEGFVSKCVSEGLRKVVLSGIAGGRHSIYKRIAYIFTDSKQHGYSIGCMWRSDKRWD